MNRPGMSKLLCEVVVVFVLEDASLNHSKMHKIYLNFYPYRHQTARQSTEFHVGEHCMCIYIYLRNLNYLFKCFGGQNKIFAAPWGGKPCNNYFREPSILIVVVVRAAHSISWHRSQNLRVGKLDAGCWPTSSVFSENSEHSYTITDFSYERTEQVGISVALQAE